MSFPDRAPAWRRYLRFWRADPRADVDEELAFHFAERIAELVASGLDADAARRQAAEEFGDVAATTRALYAIDRRLARRRGAADTLRAMVDDLRYAARSLARTPIVAGTIVLTLALGLGLDVAMYSLLDVIYLRPPAGVTDPGGVHRVWRQVAFEEGVRFWSGYDVPEYLAIRDAVGRDGAMALYSVPEPVRSGDPDAPRVVASWVSADFFPLLGVRAARGRTFSADEDRFGAPTRVAVVSDAYWRSALGADPAALGRAVKVGKYAYTVIGVMPPGFAGVELDATAIWLPLASFVPPYGDAWWTDQNINGFRLLLRPRAGLALAPLEARITQAIHRPELVRRPADTLLVARLGSIIAARGPGEREAEVRIAARLGGVAVIVLLVALANVINLLLARGARRRREIAVRVALGISKRRLIAMLVVEGMLLATVASVAAVLAAWWGGALLRVLLLPDVHWAASPMQGRVLAFAVAITLVVGLTAGLVPAVRAADPDLNETLKSGGREGSVRRSRLRTTLVVAQCALSTALLVAATLFLDSLANVRALDIGFDASHLVFAGASLDASDSTSRGRLERAIVDVAQRLRAAPGVEQVALTGIQPMGGFRFTTIYPEADTLSHHISEPTFDAVSPGYFRTIGLRFIRGTGFGDDAERAVVINRAMADGLWPGENAVGRCIHFDQRRAPCFTIVGVVETARRNQIIEDPKPQYYVPFGVAPFDKIVPASIVVRAEPDVRAVVEEEIRAALRRELPAARPRITLMSDALEPQYRPWKLGATLFTLFGFLSLVVAAVGVYGTIAYDVGQRSHEFGVRIALGARAADISRLVIGSGIRLTAAGAAIGCGLVLLTGRLVASLLYGVAPTDVRVLAGVAAFLLLVAVLAASLPARRAAATDPMEALRSE